MRTIHLWLKAGRVIVSNEPVEGAADLGFVNVSEKAAQLIEAAALGPHYSQTSVAHVPTSPDTQQTPHS
jgi:hypothetical protein